MAGEIKGITVEIGGDTSGLAKALKALNSPIKSAERELKEVEKLLKLDPSNTVALTQKQQLLNQRVVDTSKKLEILKDTKEKVDAAMKDGTKINQEEYRKLQREIELTEKELQKVIAASDNFSERGEKLRLYGEKIEAVGQKVKGVTDAFKPLSAAVLAIDAAAVKVGMDYSGQMSKVQAITTASAEEMEQLKAVTRDIGISDEFVATATEAGEALEYMGLAGWDTVQSIANLPAVLNTATAAGMELGQTSDIITDYLTAFNLATDDAARLADVMAYAQSNSNTSIEQLAGAYKNCAANANSMGYEVEDVTADLAMMANQGLKGEKAGTTLNAVYRDITKQMKDGAVAINGHTIAVQNQEGNYRRLSDIITDVKGATAGMGTAEKNAALMAVFTSESLRGLNLLLNAGGQASASFADELRNSAGAAESAAAIMRDNLSGDLEITKGKLEAAGLEIYEVLEPALRSAVSAVGDAAAAFANMDDGAQKLIVTVGGFAATIPAVGTAISGVTKIASVAASGLSVLFTNPVGLAVAATGALTAGVLALGDAVYGETEAEEEARIALEKEREARQNKIEALEEEKQALEEAVEARQVSIVTSLEESTKIEILSGELRTLVDENGRVKEGYEDRVNYILGELNEAFGTEYKQVDGIVKKYGELNSAIDLNIAKMQAHAVLGSMESDYQTAFANFTEMIGRQETASAELAAAKDKLTEAEKNYSEAMKEATKTEESAGYSLAGGTGSFVSKSREAEQALKDAQDEVKKWSDEYNNAATAVNEATDIIGNYQKVATALTTENAEEIRNALSGVVVQSYAEVKKEAEESGLAQVEAADYTMRELLMTYNRLATDSNEVYAQFVDGAKAAVDNGLSTMAACGEQMSAEMATDLRAAGFQVSDSLVANVNEAKDAAETAASDAGKQVGTDYTTGLVEGVDGGKTNVSTAGTDIGDALNDSTKSALGEHSPSATARQMGVYFAQGLANGITAGRSQVINAATQIAASAVTAAKNKLEIKSPSKVMKDEVGAMIVAGMVEGIEENRGLVVEAAEGVTAQLLTAEEWYLQEKERIEKEHEEYAEAQRVKQYEERLAYAKDAAERQKIIDEEVRQQKERADQEYLDGLKAIADEEKKIAKEREERAKETVDFYAGKVKAVIDDYEDLNSTIEKMKVKLQDYRGDELYLRNAVIDKDGSEIMTWFTLPDLSAQTSELKEYYNLLIAVKDRGADPEVFDILRSMDVEEATDYATALMGATDEEFDRYMDQQQEKRETAQQIAYALYSDEAETLTTQFETVLSESMTTFAEYGYDAGEEFMENFKKALEPLRDIVNFVNEYAYGGSINIDGGGSSGGGNTVTYNVTQNIGGSTGSPAENAAAINSLLHRIEVTGMMGG